MLSCPLHKYQHTQYLVDVVDFIMYTTFSIRYDLPSLVQFLSHGGPEFTFLVSTPSPMRSRTHLPCFNSFPKEIQCIITFLVSTPSPKETQSISFLVSIPFLFHNFPKETQCITFLVSTPSLFQRLPFFNPFKRPRIPTSLFQLPPQEAQSFSFLVSAPFPRRSIVHFPCFNSSPKEAQYITFFVSTSYPRRPNASPSLFHSFLKNTQCITFLVSTPFPKKFQRITFLV